MSSYDLSRLDPSTFEHMVVSLALRELGAGVTMFGPGPDGGRDGYFEGEANYPSPVDRWKGRWYIQSKFHAPGLTDDAQTWLRSEITAELKAFASPKREWPDNWIVITNVDPSAAARNGTVDVTRQKVAAVRPELAARFHIWGGKKITDFLSKHKDIAERYGDFLTPGHVLKAMYDALQDDRASAERIVRHLIAGQIVNQAYAKLEQAGKSGDMPGLHRLFSDIPFRAVTCKLEGEAAVALAWTSNRNQRPSTDGLSGDAWRQWRRHPLRARTWFVRGGPGQGKSTLGQFFAQVQRAWFLLEQDIGQLTDAQRVVAGEVRAAAEKLRIWPASGRIPVLIELKEYAQWLGARKERDPRGILTYLSQQWRKAVQQDVAVGMVLRLLAERRWFLVFDGLDEVPQDVKNTVATEVRKFLDEDVYEKDADVLVLCTSRPQGYSGQFDTLDAAAVDLTPLSIEQALNCAEPLLRFQQSTEDADRDVRILTESSSSESVKQLMTTPLQSHIMAVVVRGGHRPPERRWKLFDNFYDVILKREANRPGIDPRLAKIFKSHDDLLKTVHNRLGFVLHASAERSAGAVANLRRADFEEIVRAAAQEMLQGDVETTVHALMEATTDRLVLVNTPDDGNHVRFDVRQLQEFFAAEFLREYDPDRSVSLPEAFELLGADSHWREVTHFLLSALVEKKQGKELDALTSVLQRFDDGEGQGRLVRRRLARGALAVARILAEGVLEQDKRMRAQLRATLLPAFGAMDGAALQTLSEVRQPQSQSWLIDVLIDSLKELSRTESVGAAAVLLRVMPKDDPRGVQAEQLLLTLPVAAVCLLIRAARTTDCLWFVTLVIDLLRRSSSLELSTRDVESIGNFLSVTARVGRTAFKKTVRSYRNDRERLLLHWLIARTVKVPDPSDIAAERAESGTRTTEPSMDSPSLLAALDAIANFASQRSVYTLRSAAGVLMHIDNAGVLPPEILSHIPVDWSGGGARQELSALADATETDLAALWRRRDVLDMHVSSVTQAGWRRLVEHSTTLALSFVDHAQAQPESSLKMLVERLLQNPLPLMSKPNLWGLLIRQVPDLERELRCAIRITASTSPPICDYIQILHPLQLELPDDAPLLPHLVFPVLGGAQAVTDKFVKGINGLRAIAADENSPTAQRLAALLFAAFHREGDGWAEMWPTLVSLDVAEHPWFLEGLVARLWDIGSIHDACAVAIAAHLIDAFRDNYRVRDLLDRVFQKWREKSAAPVTTAGVLNDWVRRAPTPLPPARSVQR